MTSAESEKQNKEVVLVSINTYDLPDIRCVTSFKNLDFSEIECLIFHSTSDSNVETVLALSDLKEVVSKIIYINKNINPLYYCIFMGLDADIYDAEENLLDPEIVNYMVDSYKDTGLTLKSPSTDVEVLIKSIAKISDNSIDNIQKLVSNDFWLKTLSTAVSNVDNAISRASEVNINVVEMLSEAYKYVESLDENHTSAILEKEKLERYIEEYIKNVGKADKSEIINFTRYKVPATVKKVLYIKAFGQCRFLNSFILAYQHYLKMVKQINSKVMLAFPKLKINMRRYNNLPRLARDSVGMKDLERSEFYVTYEPMKMVMDEFFGQSNVGLFIIVDLMMGETLVEGHMVETMHALSSFNDLERFSVEPKDAILPMLNVPGAIHIPFIKGYAASTESNRRTLYFNKCSEMFKKLDERLQLGE